MEAKCGVFVHYLGASPRIKVLEHFLINDNLDVSKSYVAKEAEVSRATLEPIWDELEEEGIIKKTRSVGRAELYTLDKSNKTVRVLQEFLDALAWQYADEEEARLKQKITAKKQKRKN